MKAEAIEKPYKLTPWVKNLHFRGSILDGDTLDAKGMHMCENS